MKLMILDGNSVVNRAYYGIRPLTTRSGFNTNAIFGFLNILHRMENEESPDALCVAFDLKAPTFRHLMYDGYKATRHGMPDELAEQMPVLKEVLAALRIPIYQLEGWEADDILGTVGRLCEEAGWDCVVVTGDRDSLQLVDERVTVKLVTTKGGQTLTTRYDPGKFHEDYGFDPIHLIDLKALMGDSSDNIPGVKGVGEKTAMALIQLYGSIDHLYSHMPDICMAPETPAKPNVVKKLAEGEGQARMSYTLATIRTDAPIAFSPDDNLVQKPDKAALRELFLNLEFTRLMDRYRLNEPDAPDAPDTPGDTLAVNVLSAFPEPGEPFALALDLKTGQAAVATAAGVLPFPLDARRAQLHALLISDTPRCCADCKALYHALDRLALPTGEGWFDVSLADYLLDPSRNDYGAAALSARYLGQTLSEDSPAVHAAAILALRPLLERLLDEQGMRTLYDTVELPLCRVLAGMERLGVAVDRDALSAFSKLLSGQIDTLQEQIYELAGETFNINSPQQLGAILFEKLGLPAGKKTKTGYSTSADVLEKLKSKHPIVQAVLDYRMLTKLNSTYAEGLLKVIAPDGRIHTTFQNMVTATGRLSSTEPNLQNIPVRTELGGEFRKMFVPRPGWVLADADYSQIELRVLAHIAGDKRMQEAFQSGEDIHRVTASQVFGLDPDEVTAEMRRSAKAVNFGIVYGISEFSLAEDIGVSRKEAKAYIESYLEKYSGIRDYMHNIVEQARQDGYVTTLLGRRRYLPELTSKNFNLRSFGERCAMNTPIQGTAADIIKMAMVKVAAALEREGLAARLVLQVHDELIVECPAQEAEQVLALLEQEMEQVVALSVPLLAEAKEGKSWYDAK